MKRRFLPLVALLPLLLCSCNLGDFLPGHIKQGYLLTEESDRLQASYEKFTGSDWAPLDLVAGQQARIGYRITVRKGSVRVTVLSPSGKDIWSETWTADAQGNHILHAESSGTYALIVEGDQAAGSYSFIWVLE